MSIAEHAKIGVKYAITKQTIIKQNKNSFSPNIECKYIKWIVYNKKPHYLKRAKFKNTRSSVTSLHHRT